MPVELLIPSLLAVFGALGLGAMGLVGLRMWIKHQGVKDPSQLAASIREQLMGEVRDEIDRALDARQGEIDELYERLDFAERMLSQARLPKGKGVND